MMRLISPAGKTAATAGIALLALTLMLTPDLAQAKGKGKGGHGYYDHHYNRDYRPRDYHRGYHRDYRPRGRPHEHHHHHYHQRSKKRSNEGAYLLGGIVIGSVLTHVLQPPRSHYAPAPTVVHQAPVGRRLLKDVYGDCYERRGHGSGEVLIPLPQWECAW
jgi:hypothetical protein